METVYILGIGMTAFGRHAELSLKQLAAQAVAEALADANAQHTDIEEIYFANCVQGYMDGQHMVRGHCIFLEQDFQGIPIFNLESGCASGSMAFHHALRSIRSGQTDLVMAVGAEKMVHPDKSKMFHAFSSAWDIHRDQWQRESIAKMLQDFPIPAGSRSDKPYSQFMDVYQAEFIQYAKQHKVTQRQIAEISAKNHCHSVHNDKAQFRQPYSAEQILAASPVTFPLTVPMCAPVSDGAAALLLGNAAALRNLNIDRRRAIRVLGSETGSALQRDANDLQQHIVTRISRRLYQRCDVQTRDINVVELHDATAVGELLQVELLGLCEPGQSGQWAMDGVTRLGGELPINPSGGLESRGHPIAATGIAQLYELTLQLRGEAGARQVDNANVALQCNVGGFWGIEEASAHVALLSR